MSYSSQEIRSGLLITLSLVLFIFLTFMAGRFAAGRTETWQIQFGYVSGLEKNAPVHFAGHQVGKVDRIEIVSEQNRPVLVTVRVSEKVRLRNNTQSFVDTLGLMGEKFVELTPGTPDSPTLQKGAVIQGTDPIPMHQLIQKMNLLADRMDQMTADFNPLIQRMNQTVSGHQEEIAKTISNLHEVSTNLRDMTRDLKFHPWRLLRKG